MHKVVYGCVAFLIIFGGLGWAVLYEWRTQQRERRFWQERHNAKR